MIHSITVTALQERPAGIFQFVDVRSSSEFASGHIPGAVNIPMDQIESRLPDLRSDSAILLICQMGKRARMTAALLEQCRRDITVLEGGTNSWVQTGLPLIANVKTRWSLERQVRFGAGSFVLAGAILALFKNAHWLYLCGMIGLGLMFAGLTDICPMGELLGRMPWNSRPQCKVPITKAETSKHT